MTFRPIILTTEILMCCGWLQAQATVPLRIVEHHNLVTTERAFNILISHAECDGTGDIFFFTPPPPPPGSTLISTRLDVLHRLSSLTFEDGNIALDPAFKGGSIVDFAVEPEGAVFELIDQATEPYNRIVKLDKAGKAQLTIELKNSECMTGLMTAHRLGVFASGNFLVLGQAAPNPLHLKPFAPGDTGHAPQCGSYGTTRPLIAVFDPDGAFVAEVYHGSASQTDEEKLKNKLLVGSESPDDASQIGLALVASAGDIVCVILPGQTRLLTISPAGSL